MKPQKLVQILTALNIDSSVAILDNFCSVFGSDWITILEIEIDTSVTRVKCSACSVDAIKWLTLVTNVFCVGFGPTVAS